MPKSKAKYRAYENWSYGALVVKNGVLINRDEPFQEMERAVGWTDRIRYADCDCFRYEYTDYDNRPRPISECAQCPRAHYESGKEDAVSDCRGNPIDADNKDCRHHKHLLDGWYTNFIGDEDFTIIVFLDSLQFYVNRERVDTLSPITSDLGAFFCDKDCRKVFYLDVMLKDGTIVKIKIKHLTKWIDEFSMTYKGDYYRVLYGNGISTFLNQWNKDLWKIHGKKDGKKITNWMNQWIKDSGDRVIYDNDRNAIFGATSVNLMKNFIADTYDISREHFDGCFSFLDIVDVLNFYYGFKKFTAPFSTSLFEKKTVFQIDVFDKNIYHHQVYIHGFAD